ncbi:hypothetical protein HL667_03975 [Bradyrhizobium sp. 83012]|uniref:Uncharacterized protein n=1 Tax=Bradyrhizobium aeschynomenes TaxID=2734909 RepID=A0ABX2C9I5_9BRAD|nr:hypothetical protein [Bradyrhizobium aeschynomenes]NPU15072.1 hypothetical protein [Bradyrhizobium aeschynomenes]NPU64145.1 hypothetical protein [Bradyrhizobium aeschynomenes]NPV21206.1 hypothetical protein [Bradyrhizobium aeschynomenes]
MTTSTLDRRTGLALMSAAIALACVGALTMLVRDRWHPPEIKSAEAARHSMTGEVARAAGARVMPTDPRLAVEPKPEGPKRAQPANPF